MTVSVLSQFGATHGAVLPDALFLFITTPPVVGVVMAVEADHVGLAILRDNSHTVVAHVFHAHTEDIFAFGSHDSIAVISEPSPLTRELRLCFD